MNNKIEELIEAVASETGEVITQKDIAAAIKLQESTLSRYVNGHINGTKFDIEFRLCNYFTRKLNRVIRRDDLYSFNEADLWKELA